MSRTHDPHATPAPTEGSEPELSPEESARWLQAVRAAISPDEISAERHERILSAALEDPFAEPSAEELREAEALRVALDSGGEHEHAGLARALGNALGRAELEPSRAERSLEKAVPPSPARSNVIWVAFGAAASALSLAAAVALVIGSTRSEEASVARRELALSRSLAPLLEADAARLSPSERMDRMASARAKDLRENRYTAWGVR
jgi:hypothetical protein